MNFYILKNHRCIIGEGPVWNAREQRLYYTNVSDGKELCIYTPEGEDFVVRSLPLDVSAYAFSVNNDIIISHAGGVDILNDDGSLAALYDKERHKIEYANDMKVGPDGAIYVGTQSKKRKRISDAVDGRLYRISPDGEVRVLLDGLLLSNGMDWSIDESRFYHADTDTAMLKEYFFDKKTGKIVFSGRQVCVEGVDGLTVAQNGDLYVCCAWKKSIAVIDGELLTIKASIPFADTFPMSCAFCGKDMDLLAVTTASDTADIAWDKNAGFAHLMTMTVKGRRTYRFGKVLEDERENF